ncbi:MAG: hypothetical protein ACOZJX_06110 [Pseudomonadota bacterium]
MKPSGRATVSLRAMVALALLSHALPAAAYIDPGTGSALFYVVTGIIVSVYFGIRGLYYRAVEFLFRIRHKEHSCRVAIHGEDPRYESTFMPLLRQLSALGIECTYFTMYERDDSYEALPPGIGHRQIAPGLVGYAHLNHLSATLLVTTTPQLDVMTFRRSKRVRHYCMVQHALGESRFVRPYAYDHFDTVLCCGEILKQNIRRMEALRGSPAKQLLETGLPHYEVMLDLARQAPPLTGETIVLVAPSWGPMSMFEAFGTDFIAAIARRFKVLVRPHPQMKVSQPDLYARILALDGVEVDTSRTPSAAMARAHILLSDISGISHEFAFIHERPVVVIDRQLQLGGLEGELLGGDSELKQRCAEFIVPVPPDQITHIATHLERVLAGHSAERLRQVRNELVYHFGGASRVAAAQIAEILRTEDARAASRSAALSGLATGDKAA